MLSSLLHSHVPVTPFTKLYERKRKKKKSEIEAHTHSTRYVATTQENYYFCFRLPPFGNKNNKTTKKTNIYDQFGYLFSFRTVAPSTTTSSMHYVIVSFFMNRTRYTRETVPTERRRKYEGISGRKKANFTKTIPLRCESQPKSYI